MKNVLIVTERMSQKLKIFPPKRFPIQSKLTSQISIKVLKPSKMVKNTLKKGISQKNFLRKIFSFYESHQVQKTSNEQSCSSSKAV